MSIEDRKTVRSPNGLPGPALLQQEMLWFILVSAMDIFMTYILLSMPDGEFHEANPIARYFIYGWGLKGMVYFKMGMAGFVCVISQIIARKKPKLGKFVLNGATLVVASVVIYSVYLLNKPPVPMS